MIPLSVKHFIVRYAWVTILLYTNPDIQGPVVQSIVSLTSLFCKSYSHLLTNNINVFAIFQNRDFNITLANNFVKFEHLGPYEKMYLPVFYLGDSQPKYLGFRNDPDNVHPRIFIYLLIFYEKQ